jgi:pimeloyl-ACP methyl ester carboxylesterase
VPASTNGTPGRPPLLYLPGIDGTGRLLHRQVELHAEYDVRCEAYPQDRPVAYDELAAAAARRLEQAGGRPATVLAESFGGAVALTLAVARPDLIERLVLVNTFAYFPARLRLRLAAWAGRRFPARPAPAATRGVRGLFFFPRSVPATERAAWWERTADVPLSAYGHRLPLILGLDLRLRLPAVTAPALVFAASDDRVVPPAAGRELARLLPRARLLEFPAGHSALISPRVNVAAWLRDASLWPAGPAKPA